MSENNNEQFKMPPKRPRGPMGHGPGMVTEKAKDFKGSTKKLIKYLGRYWAAIIAVMIFAAVSTVFSVAGPKIMGKATTALAEGLMNKIAGTGGIDFDYIAKVLLIYAGFICGECHLYVRPGTYHDRHHAEDLLQDA